MTISHGDAGVDPNATIEAWLDQLYGQVDDGWLTLFSVDPTDGEQRIDWAPVDDYDLFVEKALRRAPTCNVYWGVATRRAQLLRGRGVAEDCAAIPALWVDVDVAGPNHKTPHPLPPTVEAAVELLGDFALPPTAVVHSGGGLQAWWLLAEPADAGDIGPLLNRWRHTWQQLAGRRGWHVDNVFDVARVMRLPGTHNRKGDEPVQVEVLEADWGLRYGTDDLDQWLEEPPVVEAKPAPAPWEGPPRPGDAFNAQHTTSEVLGAEGWVLVRTDGQGEHWTRPGKDPRQGTSATVYLGGGEDGHCTIWSDAVPGVEPRRPYDAFGLLTVLRYGGDHTAASDELERLGYGTKQRPDDLSWVAAANAAAPLPGPAPAPAPPDAAGQPDAAADGDQADDSDIGATWQPTAIADVLAGIVDGTHTAPEPALGEFCNTDGALWYAGRVNGLYGESGTGKTWIAIAVAAEVMQRGGNVAWVDLEEPAEGILHRLIALGVAPDVILERFTHFAPEESITLSRAMQEALDARPPELVVIDSTGEGLSLEGAKPNNDDEVAAWMRHWARRPAARWGAGVILIDHVIKDVATRGLNPGGSQRKKAAITGSAFMVEAVNELGKGRIGLLKITTAKDRNGRHVKGHTAAEFTLDATRPTTTWRLEAPVGSPSNPGEFRPTTLMGRVSAYLAEVGEASARDVEKMVNGKGTAKRQALAALVEEGYAEKHGAGPTTTYRHRQQYDGSLEWVHK